MTKESSQDKGQWPGPFPSHWASASFAESFDNVTSSRLKLAQKKYEEAGVLPVIDQGAEPVGGYTNDESLRHPGPLPSIIFGDHTRCVKFIERPFVQGADGVKVLAPRLFEPRFSFWALKTLQLPDRGYARHFKFLKASRFPVPPINEQRRIVAKIEDLTARSRAAKQALDAIPPLLERFRQSVLAAAFRGDLTKQWRQQNPNTEPASELLKRIRQERRHRWEQDYLQKQKAKGKQPKNDKWKAKYKEPEPVDTTDLPELPEGWCWVSLNQLIVDGPQNGLYVPQTSYGSGTPMLRIEDFQDNWCRPVQELKCVAVEDDIVARYALEPGDIVINRVNSPSHLGKSIALKAENVPCLFESNMMKAKLSRYTIPELCTFYLQSPAGRKRLLSNAKWAVNQASINQGDVCGTAFPLPPFNEQIAILREVAGALSSRAAVSADSLTAHNSLSRLDQSILAKAFRGELVPQDPNDEPASALLKRIRANGTKK